jgi:hypothetical protein
VNKKQKMLTIVALAVFGLIIFLHYYDPTEAIFYEKLFGGVQHGTAHPAIFDIHMPIFVLAVFYAGLFFILAGKRPPPGLK